MAEGRLAEILTRLRRRLIWVTGWAGGLWSVLAAVICLVAGVWLDLLFELPPLLRITTLLAAGVSGLVLMATFCRMAMKRGGFDSLARRLDAVSESGGQILSAVDLVTTKPKRGSEEQSQLTAGLAEIAVDRAAALAENVSHSQAVSFQPVRQSLAASFLLMCAVAAAILFLPRLAMTQWLRFSDPYGDHPPYSRVIFHVEPTNAKVFYGERLDVHVRTEGVPVESVSLVFRQLVADSDKVVEETLPMFPEPGGKWRATISHITSETEYFVRAHRARSRRYTIDVLTVPRIDEVRFRITPPPYTRGPVYEGELPQGGLAGLPGTNVNVILRSNRPLSAGTLRYTVGEEHRDVKLTPLANDDHAVTGTFKIDLAGNISATVSDTNGQKSRDVVTSPIVLLTDDRPFVRMLQPRAVSFATPTAAIPVVISAEDDYGISRLQLFRNLNDSRYLPMDVSVAMPPAQQAYRVVQLPLDDYGLQPGDEIKLFARVEDNNPVEVNGAESSVVMIRIVPPELFARMQRTRDGLELLTSKYRQAQRRMESLAEEIEKIQDSLSKLPDDEKLAQEQREQLQRLIKQQKEEQEALRKLAEQKLPYDLDRELATKLEEMQETLQRLIKRTETLAGNAVATAQMTREELQQMLAELGRQQERLEQEMMEPLRMLAAAFKLMADESRFIRIYRRQRELAERLLSLKGRDGEDDPALKVRMRELEEEQQRIRADLEELLDDIKDHATGLPEDDPEFVKLRKTALRFVEGVRNSGANEAMTEAESGLAEFSGTRGHSGAKEAADILETFLSKSKSMGQSAKQCLTFQPRVGQSLSQTAQQLLADAGLGNGNGGQGNGGGGGYSTRRSTLQNVGLYGGIPLSEQSSGKDGISRDAIVGTGRGGRDRMGRELGGGVFESRNALNASGTGEAVVPLRYRRKVGRYFQRIADEIGSE